MSVPVCIHSASLSASCCVRSQTGFCLSESSLNVCVGVGAGAGAEERLILCCPCRFPISRPVTAGTGVTVDQCCLLPTSAFLWFFRVMV